MTDMSKTRGSPLQLQSISLSRGLIDPGGAQSGAQSRRLYWAGTRLHSETTVYRMVQQIIAGEFPCQLAGRGDLLLTTFWIGKLGRYAIHSELTGSEGHAAT